MRIFLKLPKEVLSLIISHIEDSSIIESLIFIPGLQHIALEQKYSNFEINSNNKSIEKLVSLFQKYQFIPSNIIGDLNQINQLSDEPAFRLANYELKILRNTKFSDFVSILNKFYVIGIHLDQYLEPFVGFFEIFKKNEVQSFLNYVGSMNIQSLTTSYLSSFKIQFPKSLKELTINGGVYFELDLRDLHYLESFNCKNLDYMSSLENFQLPISIKNLRLYSCDFKSLGNLIQYNKLKLLHISYCPEIFDIVHTEFPNSLIFLNFVSNFMSDRVDESDEEELLDQASDDDLRVRIDGDLLFPSNLKKLRIYDTMQTLKIGAINFSDSLNCLELKSIGEIDLKLVLDNLPRKMFEIIIEDCLILYVEYEVLFPESKQIKFSRNKVYYHNLQSNLNQLESLKELDVSDNFNPEFDDVDPLDPLDILTHMNISPVERVCFKTPQLQSLILKSPKTPSIGVCEFPSEVLFNCKNLTKINMINLNINFLNFNEFPNSLKELVIKNSGLQEIHGYFSKLDELKILDLQNNEITFSMLEHQIFPSSLNYINLSNNKIEDLSCLDLENCVHLKELILKEVTAKDEPEGAIDLMQLFSDRGADAKANAILTNYDSKVIFKFVNGVEEESILKSVHKRRKIF
ncbi:uncharacterized protein KGF55_005075 [Candida pseudojiufengensis]|uniref:uncharacterized protein n=1 Tax=Candida pseudojiufengensis TaxID=497109 RepID=UPI00222560A4|nr:uncharacterized protein KGF55_005075 [Candida pseudojiufengensis]KAI5959843.1 hypothetical protein KGF55_005075 [Candida pseudojiufengensis]